MDLPYKLPKGHRLYSDVVAAGDQPLELNPGAVIHKIEREGIRFHLLWSSPDPMAEADTAPEPDAVAEEHASSALAETRSKAYAIVSRGRIGLDGSFMEPLFRVHPDDIADVGVSSFPMDPRRHSDPRIAAFNHILALMLARKN